MPKIETVLSPALFQYYQNNLENKNVVVIDILRATTSMIVAMENGAKSIFPVENIETALSLKTDTNIIAGERNGLKVEGFDLGNSPQEFTKSIVQDKNIVISTTNGTKAIDLSKGAKNIFVASFRNLNAMANFLKTSNQDVLLFCAGWKNKCNIEDTLFAGAVIELLFDENTTFETSDDSSHLAFDIWKSAKSNLFQYLQKASHVKRFQTLHVESDLEVCLKMNTYNNVLKF